MSVNTQDEITREAMRTLGRLITRVGRLEANDYFQFFYVEESWASGPGPTPPTKANLNTWIGTPDELTFRVYAGIVYNTSSKEAWLVLSNRSQNDWYYIQLNDAI